MGGGERMGRSASAGTKDERARVPKSPSANAPEATRLPGRALTALTTSALAVPGLATQAVADTPIEQASASYAFSRYDEDNLDKSKKVDGTDGGSTQRYEVLTHQIEFDLPVSPRMDAGVDFLYEKMSGASPWFVQASGTERLQVMSGATIDDTRYDLSADLDYYMEDAKDTVSTGFSMEQDYLSVHGGIGTERSFFDKNTTFSASGGFAYDWIDPNNDRLSLARPNTGEKYSIDLFAGLSQLLTRASAVQGTVNFKYSNGYLSDPYKAIRGFDVNDEILSDRRPDEKHQASLLLRYRHHIEKLSGSAHADYRFYVDDWGVNSHTFELAWHQNIFDIVTIIPAARYYSQGKADFYDTVLPAGTDEDSPGDRSSDYRLSPYGAMSGKVKVEASLEDLFDYGPGSRSEALGFSGTFDLIVAVSYERYFSDGAFAIESVSETDEAPALVNFQVFAFTITGRF